MNAPTRLLFLLLASFAQAADLENAGDQSPASLPARTGSFEVVLTPSELFGADGAATLTEIFAVHDELAWQLYVPPTYDPEKPAGALVYVSPHAGGGPPKDWNDVLADRNLIWIGAQNAGNEVPVKRRMFLAMFAPMVLQRDYALDGRRIYVAGLSGGGKTASRVATLRPNMFKGGIFVSGARFWGAEAPPLVDSVRGLRYVFMSGTNDFALDETRVAHRKFVGAGVRNSKLIVVGNHGHQLPGAIYFAKAIDYLDGRDAR